MNQAADTGQAGMPLPPPPLDWKPKERPRRNGALKALAVILVVFLLLSALLVSPIGRELLAGISGRYYPAQSSIALHRTMTIDVESGEIDYTCDIPVPSDVWAGDVLAQDITSTEEDPAAESIEKYGEDWLEWSGTEDGALALEVDYTATVRTVVWDIGRAGSGTASDIPQDLIGLQTGNEWELLDQNGDPTGEYMIWPDHPTIGQLSEDLTAPGLTVYENVQSVYEYMRAEFEYSAVPGSEPKSCLETLGDKEGDCDDQSILFVSLLRAAGIPSWLAFGVLYDDSRDIWGAHAWAEVHIPLEGGGGANATVDVVNDEFLVRNCNRLQEWAGDGNGDHLADYYHTLVYNYTMGGPHPTQPVVSLDDSYTGSFEASEEKIYACLGMHLLACASPTNLSRKVF